MCKHAISSRTPSGCAWACLNAGVQKVAKKHENGGLHRPMCPALLPVRVSVKLFDNAPFE